MAPPPPPYFLPSSPTTSPNSILIVMMRMMVRMLKMVMMAMIYILWWSVRVLSQKIITSSLDPHVATCNHPVHLQVSFHGFSHFQICFSWLQVGFYGFSGFQVGFYGSRSGFMSFQGSRWVVTNLGLVPKCLFMPSLIIFRWSKTRMVAMIIVVLSLKKQKQEWWNGGKIDWFVLCSSVGRLRPSVVQMEKPICWSQTLIFGQKIKPQ